MKAALLSKGLDLSASFPVAAYNEQARSIESLCELELEPTSDGSSVSPPLDGKLFGYIVGHSKAVWEPFLDWIANGRASGRGTEPRFISDPLDLFAVETIQSLLPSHAHCRLYSDLEGPLVALQRVAALANIATVNDTLHLCMHREVGPWLGLRVVIISDTKLDLDTLPALPQESLLSDEEEKRAKEAFQLAVNMPAGPERWRAWLALRDVPQLGKAYRYDEDQLKYHYTKSHLALEHALEKRLTGPLSAKETAKLVEGESNAPLVATRVSPSQIS
mmetsp:Transcript_11510/g.20390  ORF Transcript_11510/g.20390 Transcript_11510/m.20390 type:complete len:276 (+) Transcript_11510:1247-2074(+)